MISSEKLNKFINEDAPRIEGWFYPFDMFSFALVDHVQEVLGIEGGICEVGVYKGKSLVLLSHLIRGDERLFGFDLFPDRLREEAQSTLTAFGTPCSAELVMSDTSSITREALAAKFGQGLRFLHIDAGHEYHEVLHQMVVFSPFVKEGGCLVMDDYQDREFPGIEAAVLDFCEIDRPRRFVPFFSGGNKMYLCERHMSARYQRIFLDFDAIRNQSRISRVRDFDVLIGLSKLPSAPEKLLKRVEAGQFPYFYDKDEVTLAKNAFAFDQLKSM